MLKVTTIHFIALVVGLNCFLTHAASSSPNNLCIVAFINFHPPLIRLQRISDNYDYIAADTDIELATSKYNFLWKSVVGSIVPRYSSSVVGLKPIYRMYNDGTIGKADHLFTYSESEVNLAVNTFGYRYEGIRFYCANTANDFNATIPLYRFWTGTATGRHFYTTSVEEGNAIVAGGGKNEGILCYIWQ